MRPWEAGAVIADGLVVSDAAVATHGILFPEEPSLDPRDRDAFIHE